MAMGVGWEGNTCLAPSMCIPLVVNGFASSLRDRRVYSSSAPSVDVLCSTVVP